MKLIFFSYENRRPTGPWPFVQSSVKKEFANEKLLSMRRSTDQKEQTNEMKRKYCKIIHQINPI